MTNSEYEAACVTAATTAARFEGEHKLQQWDEHIATLEAALAKAQEARREVVNQYDLNRANGGVLDSKQVYIVGEQGPC